MKERQFIENIRQRFTGHTDLLIQGIGDDCAVFGHSNTISWLVTTDLLVDDIHFNREWQSAYLLGRKAIAVNISDIAAMGGEPKFALLSLAMPSSLSETWLDDFQKGIFSMLEENNCLLIGGDTAKSTVFTANVVIIGTAHPGKVLYRSGAKPDHDIYVTGPLGSAAAGLQLLQREVKGIPQQEKFLQAHFDPKPQVKAGRLLAGSGYVSAMQDISDGVATDLSHICKASTVGAIIQARLLPYEKGLSQLCRQCGVNLYDLMISGGEDYELIFTADPTYREAIDRLAGEIGREFVRIGAITEEAGKIFMEEDGKSRDITFKGFEHIS